jgi:tRNA(Ile)-lysidine synthase
LIRPLLELRRSELLDFLDSLGQPFRQDSTNSRVEHTRNRIRHDLLPVLAAQYNRDVVAALSRFAQLAAEAQSVMDEWACELADRSVRQLDGRVEIDCQKLAGVQRHMVRELLMTVWRRQRWPQQAMGFRQWQEMADLTVGPSLSDRPMESDRPAKKVFPGGVEAEKREGRLVLQRPGCEPVEIAEDES